MTSITITHFTDPGCPFAWSVEPARWRLQWLYSDQLAATGDGGYRYTCPSYELARNADGAALSAPGFQPTLAYEDAVANVAPDLTRRQDPESVAEVLEWAGEPLASAEVAAVCGIELGEAHEQLERVAREEHIGSDGLWALEPVIA